VLPRLISAPKSRWRSRRSRLTISRIRHFVTNCRETYSKAVRVFPNCIMFTPSLVKICQMLRNLKWVDTHTHTHRERERWSTTFFFASFRQEGTEYLPFKGQWNITCQQVLHLKNYVLPTAHFFDFSGSQNKQLLLPRAAFGDFI